MGTDWKHMFDDFLESAMDDSEAEQECYRIVAKFEEVESEIGDFFDALVSVFGGFVWYDAYGDSHYSLDYNEMLLKHCIYCPHGPRQGYADACETGCMVPGL